MAYSYAFFFFFIFFSYALTKNTSSTTSASSILANARNLGVLDLLLLAPKRIAEVPVVSASPLFEAEVVGPPTGVHGSMQNAASNGQRMAHEFDNGKIYPNSKNFSSNYYGNGSYSPVTVGGTLRTLETAENTGVRQNVAKIAHSNGVGYSSTSEGVNTMSNSNKVNTSNNLSRANSKHYASNPSISQEKFYINSRTTNQSTNRSLNNSDNNEKNLLILPSTANISAKDNFRSNSSKSSNRSNEEANFNEFSGTKESEIKNFDYAKADGSNDDMRSFFFSPIVTVTEAVPTAAIKGVSTHATATAVASADATKPTTATMYTNGVMTGSPMIQNNTKNNNAGYKEQSTYQNNSNLLTYNANAAGLMDGLLKDVTNYPAVDSNNAFLNGAKTLNSRLYNGSKKITGWLNDFSNYREKNKDDTLVQFLDKLDATKVKQDDGKPTANLMGSGGNANSNSNSLAASGDRKNPFDFSSFGKVLPDEIKQQIGPEQAGQIQEIGTLLGSGFDIFLNFLGSQQRNGNLNTNKITTNQEQFYNSAVVNNNINGAAMNAGSSTNAPQFYNQQKSGNYHKVPQQQEYNRNQQLDKRSQQYNQIQFPQEQQYREAQQFRQTQQIQQATLAQLYEQRAAQSEAQHPRGLAVRRLQDSFLEDDSSKQEDNEQQLQLTQQVIIPSAAQAKQQANLQEQYKQPNQQQYQQQHPQQFQLQNPQKYQRQNLQQYQQQNLQQYQHQIMQRYQQQNEQQNSQQYQHQDNQQYQHQDNQQYQQTNQQNQQQYQPTNQQNQEQYQQMNQQSQQQYQQRNQQNQQQYQQQNQQQYQQKTQQNQQQYQQAMQQQPKPSCFRENVKLPGKAFLVVSENSVAACQAQCKLIISCKFFYIRMQQNMCYLFDEFTGLMSEIGSIAGPQECPENTQNLSTDQIVQPVNSGANDNEAHVQYNNGNMYQQTAGLYDSLGLGNSGILPFRGMGDEAIVAGQNLGGALGGGLGGAGLLAGLGTNGDFLKTAEELIRLSNGVITALPVSQLMQAGEVLTNRRYFKNKGLPGLNIGGLDKQNALPPPGVGTPKVTCAAQGMTCCVPESAVDHWKINPPYLNGKSDSPECRAHFVSLQNALCATTSYDDENCDLIKTETEDFVIYQHILTLQQRMNNAICECRRPKQKNEEGLTQMEEFSTWEFSKQAINAQTQQIQAEKKVTESLSAAMDFTKMINKQGSQAINDIDNAMTNGNINNGGNIIDNISTMVGAIASAANATGKPGAGIGGKLEGFEGPSGVGGNTKTGSSDLNMSSAERGRPMNQGAGGNDILGSIIEANDIIRNSARTMQRRQQFGLS